MLGIGRQDGGGRQCGSRGLFEGGFGRRPVYRSLGSEDLGRSVQLLSLLLLLLYGVRGYASGLRCSRLRLALGIVG